MRLKSPIPPASFYSELRHEKGEFSVLELPFDIRAYRNVYNATEHDKRVIGGSIDKPYRRFEKAITGYPVFRLLFETVPGSQSYDRPREVLGQAPLEYAEDTLNLLGVKYAVVQKWNPEILSFGDYFKPDPRADQLARLIRPFFSLYRETDSLLIYRRKVDSDFLLPLIGQGWGALEDHGSYLDRPLIGTEAFIEIASSRDQRARLEIALSVILTPARTVMISLNGEELLTQKIPERESAGESRLMSIPEVDLRAGLNSLRINTPEPARSIKEVHGGEDTRPISFLLNQFSVTELEGSYLARSTKAEPELIRLEGTN
jgi:hypothetical protein